MKPDLFNYVRNFEKFKYNLVQKVDTEDLEGVLEMVVKLRISL
jgi:hypothetical protein